MNPRPMKLSDVLADCAEAVANADGCTIREAYGKLATACVRLGGYEVAFTSKDDK